MIRALLVVLFVIVPFSSPAQDDMSLNGEKIVAGLSQNRVAITANFDGSEILIYGAVKRDTPAPVGPRLEVVITIEGPSERQVVRRKEKVEGIWINQGAVRVSYAPRFYVVATTAPMAEVLSATDDMRYHISIRQAIRAIGISAESDNAPDYIAAMERILRANDEYRLSEGSVQLLEETLFRADVVLPSNLIEGRYRVRIFLTRGGMVVDSHERIIAVRKAGLERSLYNFAHEQPLGYGIASLVLALVAGWGAAAGFRFFRP